MPISGLRFLRRSSWQRFTEMSGLGAAEVIAVVQAKVDRYACQQHEIRFFERNAALVTQLKGMILAQQATRHARQIDRHADLLDGGGDLGNGRRVERRLAAHEHERSFRCLAAH